MKTTVVVNSEPLNSDFSQSSSTSRQDHKVTSQVDHSRHCPSGPIVHLPKKIDPFVKKSFLSEMVQYGPDGPKRFPNGQKQIG